MSNHPYSNTPPPPPFAHGHRRPSYATVAAASGSGSSQQPSASTSREALAREASRTRHTETGMESNPSGRGWENDAPGALRIDARKDRDQSASAPAKWELDGSLDRDEYPPFFTPSYLEGSRYDSRLRQAYDANVAELNERQLRNRGHRHTNSSLVSSPSSSSLGKIPSAHAHHNQHHRQLVQDVVERGSPSADGERLHPLPSRWNDDDKWSGVEILGDGLEVRFNGITKTSDDAAAVRSDHFMPKEVGIYYFEVTILSRAKDGLVGIGFSTTKVQLNRLPGWESESYAYHGDDGAVFSSSSSGRVYGPRYCSQDVIGCGINFRTGTAFFTMNGNHLGPAVHSIRYDRLYPSVGMRKPGEHLRVNFGQIPFVFDIDRLVDQEKQTIMAEIASVGVKELHPPDDESTLIHNLIGQYLAHQGYVETARAFSRDVTDREQSLSTETKTTHLSTDEDDIHALNRQRIRKAILDGDIDKALKYQSSYYPRLFDDERTRDIYFRLRCRKFIEMMRRYSQLQEAASPTTVTNKSASSLESNGHHGNGHVETQDTQMELDDQLHREGSGSLGESDDIDMEEEDLPSHPPLMKADPLLTAAISYGQELQMEWKSDHRPVVRRQLEEIFAVMAYKDVKDSPISHLFDAVGRAGIAEEVNGAILVSLGKPSSAALERVCAQTEVLLDSAVGLGSGRLGEGCGAAFVNVRKDFLSDGSRDGHASGQETGRIITR